MPCASFCRAALLFWLLLRFFFLPAAACCPPSVASCEPESSALSKASDGEPRGEGGSRGGGGGGICSRLRLDGGEVRGKEEAAGLAVGERGVAGAAFKVSCAAVRLGVSSGRYY